MTDRIKTAIAKIIFLISEYWLRLIKIFAFIPYYVTTSKKVTNCVEKNDFCLHFLRFKRKNAGKVEKIKGRNLLFLNKNA